MTAHAQPASTVRPSVRTALFVSLKIFLSAGIIAYLLLTDRLDLGQLVKSWESPWYLATAIGLLACLPFLLTLRWQLLLSSLGYDWPYRRLLRITYAVVFCDTIFPGGTADVVRAYSVVREFRPERRAHALSTVIVDRFVGLMGLVLLALAALAFRGGTTLGGSTAAALARGMTILGLLFVLVFLLLLAERNIGRGAIARLSADFRPMRHLLTLYDAMRSYASRGGTLVLALLLAAAGSALTIGCVYLLGLSLGESHLGAVEYLSLVPIGLVVAQLPVSPGGIGVGHAGFYSLFSLAGSSLGADLFTLFIAARFVASIPGLFCWLAVRRHGDGLPAEAQPDRG